MVIMYAKLLGLEAVVTNVEQVFLIQGRLRQKWKSLVLNRSLGTQNFPQMIEADCFWCDTAVFNFETGHSEVETIQMWAVLPNLTSWL